MLGYSIDITIWGEHCQIEGAKPANLRGLPTPPAVAIKGGRVTKINGKTVGTISNTIVFINPEIEQTLVLQNRFHENGFRLAESSMPLTLVLIKSLPSMTCKLFNHQKKLFGTLL